MERAVTASHMGGVLMDILHTDPLWYLKKVLHKPIKTAPKTFTNAGTTDNDAKLSIKTLGSGFTYDANLNVTGGTVTSYQVLNKDGQAVETVTGFGSVNAVTFFNAITNDNPSIPNGRYKFLVSLLDDNTTVTGSKVANGIEVGAGNDTVKAGGGNDTVYKWKSGNLTYDGGSGVDWLTFNTHVGDTYPTAPVQQLVINLGNGTGLNPYGGTLALKNVENVIGTPQADIITGSSAANVIGDGIYDTGADIIKTAGGNDRVNLAEGFGPHAAVRADGGTGIDTLAFNYGLNSGTPTTHTLDLKNQANNTGVFANGIFKSFEVFEPGTGFFSPTKSTLVFRDTDSSHTVTAAGAKNIITLNGGNDTLKLYGAANPYKVSANGGAGTDTLVFEVKFLDNAANTLDLSHQSKNSGAFAHSTFTSFEVFKHVELDGGFTATQRFTFIGNNSAQKVLGAVGIDRITLGGGDDTGSGSAGDDYLNGGRGRDVLSGGAGKDIFDFNSASDSGKTAKTRDVITDFSHSQHDRIDLSTIDGNGSAAGNAFHFIGKKAFDGSKGALRFAFDGTKTIVSGDIDGNKAADFTIELSGHKTLVAGDFLL